MKLSIAAFKLAEEAHNGETRWDGKTPYFEHSKAVAKRAEQIFLHNHTNWQHHFPMNLRETLMAASYLHDVDESTSYDLETIGRELFKRTTAKGIVLKRELDLGIGAVLASLIYLTRGPETYDHYIERILSIRLRSYLSFIVPVVKLADIWDNTSNLPKRHGLWKRYIPARNNIMDRFKLELPNES